MPTADDVAQWMADYVARHGELPQDEAAMDIEEKFGDRYVYENDNGNLAISREVLDKFGDLTEDTVVWEPGRREWRTREPGDGPGRRVSD